MSREIQGALEEVAVAGRTRIPGGVQIVVQVIELHDVPGMGAAAVADDDTGIHTQLQHQPVEQHGIALADGDLVHQRRIGGVLQVVEIIVQVLVIILHGVADVVVHGADLFVIGLFPQIKLVQQVGNRSIQLHLLGIGGVVGHVDVECVVICGVGVGIAAFTIIAAILPLEGVALLGVAVVDHGFRQNRIKQSPGIIGSGTDVYRIVTDPVQHIIPDLGCRIGGGYVIGLNRGGVSLHMGEVRFGEMIRIQNALVQRVEPEGDLTAAGEGGYSCVIGIHFAGRGSGRFF